MPELVTGFDVPDEIPVQLHRMPKDGAPPVLLVHGASAQSGTFLIPEGNSLADFLWRGGYEPWLLDWRGSRLVTDSMSDAELAAKRDVLDLDFAASKDLPRAIERIVEEHGDQRIHIIAHCLGAAVVAQAIASETIPLHRIGRVVLLTLGLFYEPAMDGRVKSQVETLDRLWRGGEVSIIDPRFKSTQTSEERRLRWPDSVAEVYQRFGASLRPHPQADVDPYSSHALCNRVSFMYGVPYNHRELAPCIHGDRRLLFVDGEAEPSLGERLRAFRPTGASVSGSQFPIPRSGEGVVSDVNLTSGSWRSREAEGELGLSCVAGEFAEGLELWTEDGTKIAVCGPETSRRNREQLSTQFGGIPLRMYLQGVYNVRRKWAAPFPSSSATSLNALDDRSLVSVAARKRFERLPSLLLVTGARNQLWHRDSVDRMHQWLIQGPARRSRRFEKLVFHDYGHQDLLWGMESANVVFPKLLRRGLGGEGISIPIGTPPSPGPSGPHPRA